ncbi:MAG: peptide chain release factor-like protein [Victivallaceae bacterium]
MERDYFLQCADDELLEYCQLDFFKASGNGGQKRNKTSSAVRITHLPTKLQVSDCSGRDQHKNRKCALNKLRLALALNCRQPFVELPLRYECSDKNAEFPLVAAHILDALEECGFLISDGAMKIGKSTSGLVKILSASPDLWQSVNRERCKRNLEPLKMPR